MGLFTPTWDNQGEPSQGNVRQWLDNLYSKFMPIEQSRWREANIDSLFYAGSQSFVNRYFNFAPTTSFQQYYFNLIQQPVNLVTGYERQNLKGYMYQAFEGGDNQTCDQATKLITHCANVGNIFQQRSKAKELSATSGMVLLQPYLDFTGTDPAQGELKTKIWEYNSFLVDPYFRSPDMSDAQFVWCQEYISKREAVARFGEKVQNISPMMGSPQRYGNFYFLPENYNMARNDLLVLSYVWYKSRKRKKKLYSEKLDLFFDYAQNDPDMERAIFEITDMQVVEVDAPCWMVCVVLNDQVIYQGPNPMGDIDCPFVPYYWNYDPHLSDPTLRVRSLVKPMRDPQFLFNYKVIQNNDIAAATINSGWKRKQGAVVNEDNLKKTGQGWDIIIRDGFELTDCEKIIPSAVPESDLALAQQMADLIYNTSGINMENWAGQSDKQISALTSFMKQAANLLVFQKYFDQWDYADRLLGDKLFKVVQNKWKAEKIRLLIGEEPSPFFFSKIFTRYQVLVEPADLTPMQQNLQAQQMMEINERFQREVFPPSMIIPKLNITGKGEIIPFLQEQEQRAAAAQNEAMNIEHTVQEAQLKRLMAETVSLIASAKERVGRADSNVGLLEERISEISKNESLSTKAKLEALEKMIDVVHKYGEFETAASMQEVENLNDRQDQERYQEREIAKRSSDANKFMQEIMGSFDNQMNQRTG